MFKYLHKRIALLRALSIEKEDYTSSQLLLPHFSEMQQAVGAWLTYGGLAMKTASRSLALWGVWGPSPKKISRIRSSETQFPTILRHLWPGWNQTQQIYLILSFIILFSSLMAKSEGTKAPQAPTALETRHVRHHIWSYHPSTPTGQHSHIQ